jgi:hypothetical protein
MRICVGAVSQRVVEVAAECCVPEIIASRRQVDIGGGYTGYDQHGLVDAVRMRSTTTEVVRDHGGPMQGGALEADDDDIRSMMRDIEAGFDAIHVDVCKLPRGEQENALLQRMVAIDGRVPIEVGGEHENHIENMDLIRVACEHGTRGTTTRVKYGILQTGAKIWGDQQVGMPLHKSVVADNAKNIRQYTGVGTKTHNQDWFPRRRILVESVDACNIAPEYAKVEVQACLDVLDFDQVAELLNIAYSSRAWERWFNLDEGTWRDRAVCAVRYVMQRPVVKEILTFEPQRETYVREVIRDAILRS